MSVSVMMWLLMTIIVWLVPGTDPKTEFVKHRAQVRCSHSDNTSQNPYGNSLCASHWQRRFLGWNVFLNQTREYNSAIRRTLLTQRLTWLGRNALNDSAYATAARAQGQIRHTIQQSGMAGIFGLCR